jgi:hypothetical protein
MRAHVIGLLLSTLLLARPASAYDPYDLANCNGIGWDDKRILVVAKVTAKPHVSFVKSPYDDDFKAEGCPAATGACQNKSYLVTGDLVLTGRVRGSSPASPIIRRCRISGSGRMAGCRARRWRRWRR